MNSRRAQRGQNIAEFGSAVFALFLIIVFPMINLVASAVTYATCAQLHTTALREVALTAQVDSRGTTIKNSWESLMSATLLRERWIRGGIFGAGRTCHIFFDWPQVVPGKGSETLRYVRLRMTAVVMPFIQVNLPGLNGIPGLGRPMVYSFDGERAAESIIKE